MSIHIKTIRNYIGDNRLEEAIEQLVALLENEHTCHDLYDQTLVQKSNWHDYVYKDRLNIAKKEDLNVVIAKLLDILRTYEKRKNATPVSSASSPPTQNPTTHQQPPVPNTPRYIARCFFYNDMNAYYVLENNQVVMFNAMTNQSMIVAMRTIPLVAGYAWNYQFPDGRYYSIDGNGAIWGINFYGLPVQLGYVQYL